MYNPSLDFYESNTASPVQGETYTLKVNHADYAEITATSSIPLASAIGATNIGLRTGQASPILDGTTIENVPVEFELEDPAGDNYYHILFRYELKEYRVIGLDTVTLNGTELVDFPSFAPKGKNEDNALLFAPSRWKNQALYLSLIHI